jgi:hypothetical protein
MKVAICVPCRDSVMSGFCFDLAKMVGYHSRNTKDEIYIYQMPGTLIFHQREKLAKEALAAGAEAILWIDSDMRFPSDTLERLLSHNVDIVGVNATTRREPILPTALDLEVVDDTPVFRKVETRGKDYVEEVAAVGFGVTLTRKSVFDKMPQPWFDILWTDKGGILGEDVHFCIKAQDFGIKTYVDHVLSPYIKHIGTKEYGWDDINVDNKLHEFASDSSKLPSKK